MKSRYSLGASLLAALSTQLFAAPLTIDAAAQQSLTLTVYNQDLGLVRDTRTLPALDAGQAIIIQDVSRQMQTETLSIKGAGQILEQNLNTNLLSHQALLQHYLGRELSLARRNPASGDESIVSVTLLSIEGDRALVQHDGQVESIPLDSDWRFIFPQLPAHLNSKPSLEFRSQGTDRADAATFSYLTGGLSWQMDYVMTLDDSGQQMSLEGLATLRNTSGVDFQNASFQLMAGTLNQPPPVAYRKADVVMTSMAEGAGITPAAFQDFQLYTLPQSTSLLDQQQKQLPLVSVAALPVSREYRHEFLAYPRPDNQRHITPPQSWLTFRNGSTTPLPGGSVRTFAPDDSARLQFIGGSQMKHTATDQAVELMLGEAFDLSIEQQQTLLSKEYDGYLAEYEIVVRNSSTEAKQVDLTVNFTQPWTLEHSSQEMQQSNSGRAQWALHIPAKDKTELHFRVRLKNPTP